MNIISLIPAQYNDLNDINDINDPPGYSCDYPLPLCGVQPWRAPRRVRGACDCRDLHDSRASLAIEGSNASLECTRVLYQRTLLSSRTNCL